MEQIEFLEVSLFEIEKEVNYLREFEGAFDPTTRQQLSRLADKLLQIAR